MKEKLTPWFPYTAKPLHKGVYKRAINGRFAPPFSYWTGHFWCIGGHDPREALTMRSWKSPHQSVPWRGLAENPAKKGKK